MEIKTSSQVLVTSGESVHNLFQIEISPAGGSTFANPISFYVTADRADYDAKRLSKVMPEAEIQLSTMARIKATYKNGERLVVRDYRSFYLGLTQDEYKATLIQDSISAEWI